ncbi:hypothetical protein Tsubulata_006116 [Turnera subulata]|uniref:Myb/SANT-like domain-containing protein n=1 Tax=Turnera subulata TaxID=218843 RepID=A0A9Q0JGT4_9ROSI|nr:hypothetical protein Tsubulata_006116 [Turnera subulata]
MADRRSWKKEEVEALIYALEDMVVEGFRADAGSFKPGTYSIILGKIKEKAPNADLQPSHIRNKMKKLKEKYTACYEMLQQSGFAWDDVKQCVSVDSKEVLDAYNKKRPKAKYHAGTPFPEYDRLCHIFGKDHATGVAKINGIREKEKCIREQQEENQRETINVADDAEADPTANENIAENEAATPQGTNPTPTSTRQPTDCSVSSRKGKRTREIDPIDKLMKCMETFVIDSKEERLEMHETMASKKQKPSEGEEDVKDDVIDALEAVRNELDRLFVPKQIIISTLYTMQNQPKHVKLFWRLDDEEKVLWAEKLASV